MTEPSMIERVARAIRFAENPLDGDPIGVMIHTSDYLDTSRGMDAQIEQIDEVCRVMARAAIEAMREPTIEMVEAGSKAAAPAEDDDGWSNTYRAGVTAAWFAMINAALRDTDGSPEGRDAQRLDGEAATAGAEGIASTLVAPPHGEI